MYSYIDSTREAHRVLVEQLSASLVTIAKDVKIQIEFNPAEVKNYRLLGYENRMLATKDFDDDRKDAGEIGAGHTVTAIYQIEPVVQGNGEVSVPAGLKYQSNETEQNSVAAPTGKNGLSEAALSGELATVALRYKEPTASESKRLEVAVKSDSKSFSSASNDFRFAASVAGFGMLLRGSKHRGNINSQDILRTASGAIGDDASGYRAEFIDLIRKFQSVR
jgi:Ca-activated chloride channel family protein